MKTLFCAIIALGSAAFAAASAESDDYPISIDPESGTPWSGREIGIDRDKLEHELIATVAAFLAGKYLEVHSKWPSSLDELLSTTEESERAKAREWFDERVTITFTQRDDDLEIACQKLPTATGPKIIVFLERASTADEVMKKIKMKRDGEPGATDNPDDAQRVREDH